MANRIVVIDRGDEDQAGTPNNPAADDEANLPLESSLFPAGDPFEMPAPAPDLEPGTHASGVLNNRAIAFWRGTPEAFVPFS